jgi:hypothetical protein
MSQKLEVKPPTPFKRPNTLAIINGRNFLCGGECGYFLERPIGAYLLNGFIVFLLQGLVLKSTNISGLLFESSVIPIPSSCPYTQAP